jgi:hypothetical protein
MPKMTLEERQSRSRIPRDGLVVYADGTTEVKRFPSEAVLMEAQELWPQPPHGKKRVERIDMLPPPLPEDETQRETFQEAVRRDRP